jgi:hypothetical protein
MFWKVNAASSASPAASRRRKDSREEVRSTGKEIGFFRTEGFRSVSSSEESDETSRELRRSKETR